MFARYKAQIPNWLTTLRAILTVVFIFVLARYRYDEEHAHAWIVFTAIVLFIVAALTDALDGYLARRWHVESVFGRIMDPLCDKVLVIGAFIMLASGRFADPQALEAGSLLMMVSGVYPWMVVVILGRELLVTGMRGHLEAKGIDFSAKASGKWKMILQSVTIPVVLALIWWSPAVGWEGWPQIVRDLLVYATLIVTVISGLPYISAAIRALRPKAQK